jgi:hypothetical protein
MRSLTLSTIHYRALLLQPAEEWGMLLLATGPNVYCERLFAQI